MDQKNHYWKVETEKNFFKRNRLYFVTFVGFIAAHLMWYKIADKNVPEEDKHPWVKFLNKYDPTKRH